MRGRVVRALRSLDAVAVENKVYPGTPDVNYSVGWVELKWLPRWPKGSDQSPVRVKHFTPQQRVWLKRRWRKGFHAYLLLQVGREWLLFDGETAALHLGKVTQPRLRELALVIWDRLEGEELIRWLTRHRN
jgi:hypothetical protein